jgi:hypothetical protein
MHVSVYRSLILVCICAWTINMVAGAVSASVSATGSVILQEEDATTPSPTAIRLEDTDYVKGTFVGALKDGTDVLGNQGMFKDGHGEETWADGTAKYVGAFKDGLHHGHGEYSDADGRKYVGDWWMGLMHGQGKFSYPDGSVYSGSWHEDERHGQGTLTHPDGRIESGLWQFDVFITDSEHTDLQSTTSHK